MSIDQEPPLHIMEELHLKAEEITRNLVEVIKITKPITEKHQSDYEAKWPIEKQFLKIHEETSEAEKAYFRKLSTEHEEHLDIIFSVLTLMHIQNYSQHEIYKAVLTCLKKFHKRGWM